MSVAVVTQVGEHSVSDAQTKSRSWTTGETAAWNTTSERRTFLPETTGILQELRCELFRRSDVRTKVKMLKSFELIVGRLG